MRALAMTGMVTASWISMILSGSAIRATPPSARMSAGTRSSAMTATAPAPSAIPACSPVVTAMITPPLSISAKPLLTRIVPISAIAEILASALEAAVDRVDLRLRRRDRPQEDNVLVRAHDVVDVGPKLRRGEAAKSVLDPGNVVGVQAERDTDRIAGMVDEQPASGGGSLDDAEQRRVGDDEVVEFVAQALARGLGLVCRGLAVAADGEDRSEKERPE